jgi:hypothetical protein
MKIMYCLLLLLTGEITIAASQKAPQTKSQLKRKKKSLEKEIKYLQDKMLYQHANADEPAKLYGSLEELKQVNEKIKTLSRK